VRRASAALTTLIATLVCAFATSSCTLNSVSTGPAPVVPSTEGIPTEFLVRGKALRRAFDAEYQVRKANHQLHPAGTGVNDFRAVVLQEIPLGTSFDDAAMILTAAGFTVGPREEKQWPPHIYRQGRIDFYDNAMFCRIDADVFLMPQSKDDWSAVHEVVADVTWQCL
jgi:hypothetical protein